MHYLELDLLADGEATGGDQRRLPSEVIGPISPQIDRQKPATLERFEPQGAALAPGRDVRRAGWKSEGCLTTPSHKVVKERRGEP